MSTAHRPPRCNQLVPKAQQQKPPRHHMHSANRCLKFHSQTGIPHPDPLLLCQDLHHALATLRPLQRQDPNRGWAAKTLGYDRMKRPRMTAKPPRLRAKKLYHARPICVEFAGSTPVQAPVNQCRNPRGPQRKP